MLTRLIAVIILQYFNIAIISTNIELSCCIPKTITVSIIPQFLKKMSQILQVWKPMHKKGYTFPGEELETCLSDGTTGCLLTRVCCVKNGHSSLILLLTILPIFLKVLQEALETNLFQYSLFMSRNTSREVK